MEFKKLLAMVLVTMSLLSAFSISASADCVDESYGYLGYVSSARDEGTGGRYKENASEVYVKPRYAPYGVTKVNTACYVGNVSQNETVYGTRYLADNQSYGIYNYVYEHGDITQGKGVLTWLGIGVISNGYVDGVWSPDSVWESGIQYV